MLKLGIYGGGLLLLVVALFFGFGGGGSSTSSTPGLWTTLSGIFVSALNGNIAAVIKTVIVVGIIGWVLNTMNGGKAAWTKAGAYGKAHFQPLLWIGCLLLLWFFWKPISGIFGASHGGPAPAAHTGPATTGGGTGSAGGGGSVGGGTTNTNAVTVPYGDVAKRVYDNGIVFAGKPFSFTELVFCLLALGLIGYTVFNYKWASNLTYAIVIVTVFGYAMMRFGFSYVMIGLFILIGMALFAIATAEWARALFGSLVAVAAVGFLYLAFGPYVLFGQSPQAVIPNIVTIQPAPAASVAAPTTAPKLVPAPAPVSNLYAGLIENGSTYGLFMPERTLNGKKGFGWDVIAVTSGTKVTLSGSADDTITLEGNFSGGKVTGTWKTNNGHTGTWELTQHANLTWTGTLTSKSGLTTAIELRR